ncbi:sensor domain-containing diguanylate cyclase [Paenibacillus glycanilyticus]|uniref:Cell signaling regulator n=1 Tax=Paenibacillus glycanilyticus TaxID=126569 RepID=A0ABQ6GCH9_9BACL|nr:sensor domain-containing diguanylate cyclase [Paenibacillus glycanilyticus]GLX67352.1 cell signaling regulator [Paenibacillus glycanilyticus]
MVYTIRPRKGFKLSSIISFVVILSVLITIFISTIIGYKTERKSLFNNTIEMNGIAASNLSKTTESLVLSMQNSLQVTADYFSDIELSDENVLSQLDFFMGTSPYFNSLTIVNSSGVIVSTSPNNLNLIGSKPDSEATIDALKLKKASISKPFKAITGRLIVLVSNPIFDREGNYKGFVGGSIYLQQANIFRDILGVQSSTANGSYFYVVDSAGNLIYHPDKERISENVSGNPVVQKLMHGLSGAQRIINSQDQNFLAGFATVPAAGWGIVSQTPQDHIADLSENVIQEMVKFSAPFVLLLVIISFWLSRMLAQPLNRLANYASRLSVEGENVKPLTMDASWNYEANQLVDTVAVAFNKLRQQKEELHAEANTDALTGLTNRRTMGAITNLWKQQGTPFSVILMDLDHFKSVNDRYGHHMGDEVLKFVASVMLLEKGAEDYCCRFGGEEFTMLLPHASEGEAVQVAERIRLRIEQSVTPIGESVTMSLGVATFPDVSEEVFELFKYADEALYQAKRDGRNRTVAYSSLMHMARI